MVRNVIAHNVRVVLRGKLALDGPHLVNSKVMDLGTYLR